MPVTDDVVATMRAYLSGDREQFQRRNEALAPGDRKAFRALLTAAFMEAVERRFGGGTPRDEIIDFVAELRGRDDQIAERLDPDATERMIAAVFDDDVETDDIDANTSVGIQMGVLALSMAQRGSDSADLEEFLDRSRAFANEILA
jgi:hypothetical protein